MSVVDVPEQIVAPPIPWTDLLHWMLYGLCQQDDEMRNNFLSDSPARAKMAKKICLGCPVRSQCLQWALETPEDAGVWGALTSRERRAVAAIAHNGTWRTTVARQPWCPWCREREVFAPEYRRLQCARCSFNWPGLLPCAESAKLTSE